MSKKLKSLNITRVENVKKTALGRFRHLKVSFPLFVPININPKKEVLLLVLWVIRHLHQMIQLVQIRQVCQVVVVQVINQVARVLPPAGMVQTT